MLDGDFTSVLAGAQRGENRAWSHLYAWLAPALRGYAIGRGERDPDDILGDVFLDLARNIQRFEGDEPGFRAWAFTSARHRISDRRRRRARKPAVPLPADLDIASGDDVEDEVERRDSYRRVLGLLDGLTPDQREVLVLRVVTDLDLEGTATVMGKPVGAVKSLQHRALVSLRRLIDAGAVSP